MPLLVAGESVGQREPSQETGSKSQEKESIAFSSSLGFQPLIELALPDQDLLTSQNMMSFPERLFSVLYWNLSPGCSPDICSSKTEAYARRYDVDVVFLVGVLEGVPEQLRKALPEFEVFPGRGICTLVLKTTGPRKMPERGFVEEVLLRNREDATDLVRCSVNPGSEPLFWDNRRLLLVEVLALPESRFFSGNSAQIYTFVSPKKHLSSRALDFGPCVGEAYVPDF